MDKINEYLKETRRVVGKLYNGSEYELIRPHLVCADGFSVSVQASEYHYCWPRINGAEKYESVELGYPNLEDSLIMDYAEDDDRPTDTVYGYVPIHIVCELVEKHGGIVNRSNKEGA